LAERVCPFWVGYILASPLRRLIHNPRKILGDYIKSGMTVLDIGCAMGFFSIGMAKMVGPDVIDKVDFVLAFYVIHEVPNIPDLMTQLHKVLKPGGKFLIVEPKGHTTVEEYKSTETAVQKSGFTLVDHPNIKRDRATLFIKN
jgi:ubiquinone/menaquinone biosynthesis C-methylase UbiE